LATLARRVAAETVGSALLAAAVVGSGIMAERLGGGQLALELLCNTVATGCALAVLILVLAPVSGAHFNPAVSAVFAIRGELSTHDLALYVVAQVCGAVLGVALAHLMFALPGFTASDHARSGAAQWLSELVATAGLLAAILGTRSRPQLAPFAIALYICSAYWFTASTSFANPALTIARSLTHSFAGIAPADVAPFMGAQLAGALIANWFFGWLLGRAREDAPSTLRAERSS